MRGLVIALFYAMGTGLGGPLASWLFGWLIGTGSRRLLSYGDLLAAGLLLATAAVVAAFGVKAEAGVAGADRAAAVGGRGNARARREPKATVRTMSVLARAAPTS